MQNKFLQFGMLLMEITSRRTNLYAFADDSSQIYFPIMGLNDGKDRQIKDAVEEEKEITNHSCDIVYTNEAFDSSFNEQS